MLTFVPAPGAVSTTSPKWSPNTDLNPAKNWDYVTGLVGFAYETPFRYDPLSDKFIPWLASAGKWTSGTTYTMTVRNGVKWSDGQALTPQDARDFAFAAEHAPKNLARCLRVTKLTRHKSEAAAQEIG